MPKPQAENGPRSCNPPLGSYKTSPAPQLIYFEHLVIRTLYGTQDDVVRQMYMDLVGPWRPNGGRRGLVRKQGDVKGRGGRVAASAHVQAGLGGVDVLLRGLLADQLQQRLLNQVLQEPCICCQQRLVSCSTTFTSA